MTLEQLKQIGQLDQLKKKNVITQEEYDTARARVLSSTDNAEDSSKPVEPPKKSKELLRLLGIFVVVIAGAILIRRCTDSPRRIVDSSQEQRDSEEFEKNKDKYSSPPESPFNPDLVKSSYLLTIKNQNSIAYKSCELTINDRFKAKVPKVDPYDTYIVAYRNLVDDDGNIYNPLTISMMEIEFYCKDYNGHSDGISLEKK